jgi:hypothetical protein
MMSGTGHTSSRTGGVDSLYVQEVREGAVSRSGANRGKRMAVLPWGIPPRAPGNAQVDS